MIKWTVYFPQWSNTSPSVNLTKTNHNLGQSIKVSQQNKIVIA